jgi:hypothetical protein
MLADGETLEASAIPINEVRDAVAYLVLLRLASQKKSGRSNPRSKQLGFDVKLSGLNGGVADTALFTTSNFVVSREATDAA